MDKVMSYIKNTSLVAVALLAVFVGGAAVAVILDVLSWETVGDWTIKAVLIAVVVVIVSAVVGYVGSMSSSSSDEE